MNYGSVLKLIRLSAFFSLHYYRIHLYYRLVKYLWYRSARPIPFIRYEKGGLFSIDYFQPIPKIIIGILHTKTGKHIIVSEKQKIIGVDNMEDNDEDANQFEEMSLFTNPINIKHIKKDFDKNLLLYMRKGGKRKFV
jgi:hypothetical protein